MSSANDILGAIGIRPQGQVQQPTLGAGLQPGGQTAGQALSARFTNVLINEFRAGMTDVYESTERGGFDDPAAVAATQAAEARLRAAVQGRQPQPGVGSTTEGGGANAAPDPGGTSSTSTGTSGPAGVVDGVAALQVTPGVAVEETRGLFAARKAQAESRLANVSSKLRAQYPSAASLPQAFHGWDPETFVPKTREEAEAFAQRMVIDATEAAARLELVQTMRDSARFEAATTGSPEATALVAKLDAEYERQKTYVDRIARIVDNSSNGAVSAAGREAMHGQTLRDAGDVPVDEIVAAMRASGMDEAAIKRVVGAQELAVEEDRTVGGSQRLRQVATDTAEFTWVNRYNLQRARAQQELRIQERERQEEERYEQKRQDRKRQDERAAARRQERNAMRERAIEARAEQQQFEARYGFQRWAERQAGEQRAEFHSWLQQLAAEADQRAAS